MNIWRHKYVFMSIRPWQVYTKAYTTKCWYSGRISSTAASIMISEKIRHNLYMYLSICTCQGSTDTLNLYYHDRCIQRLYYKMMYSGIFLNCSLDNDIWKDKTQLVCICNMYCQGSTDTLNVYTTMTGVYRGLYCKIMTLRKNFTWMGLTARALS